MSLAAKQIALQTLQEAQQQETTRVIGRAQRLLGRILAGQGNYDEADTYFEQAVQMFRAQELRLDYARALHGYGITLVQRSLAMQATTRDPLVDQPQHHSMYQRGMDYLHEARTIFNTSHAPIDFSWVDLVISNCTSTITEGVL